MVKQQCLHYTTNIAHIERNERTRSDKSKAVHLIGISHILTESESNQGQFRSSVSSRSEENESSTSGHRNETSQNGTHIIYHSSSGSDPDDIQFPFDEETADTNSGSHPEDCAEQFDNEKCKMVFRNDSGQHGTSPQKPPEGKFVITSDDI